jgi:hypothetical protein
MALNLVKATTGTCSRILVVNFIFSHVSFELTISLIVSM